jgi:predicted site-specific integrase-resolvase
MSVLPLNEAQAMTFDRHRNVVLYERILAATNDLAKRRVEAVAGIKWDEIVTKAIIG